MFTFAEKKRFDLNDVQDKPRIVSLSERCLCTTTWPFYSFQMSCSEKKSKLFEQGKSN